MLRRHFFLAGAILVLILMIVAGGAKILLGKPADSAGGSPGASAPKGGGPGGGGPGGGGGKRAGGPGGPTQVTMITVETRTFTDTIDVLGVAKGRQSVTLTAATTQLVDKVRFTPGQAVAKGAILVELKASEQDAGLVQSQAKALQAEREYQRWKTLADKGFASKSAVDLYEANWLSAKADVAAAQARQGDRMIRAPFAGVVGLSDIAPGALVNPGAAIVTLDAIDTIRVDFQIPDRDLAAVHEGQMITASVDAYPGEKIAGRIARLDTRIDEKTRALTARAEFPNPGHKLKPGMMLRVAIAEGLRQAPAAPESALSVQSDNAFVYVINSQGGKMFAEQRPVVTGVRQDGFVEIKDGVAPGEKLVGDGLNKIQPGQPVRVGGGPGGAGKHAGGKPGLGAGGPRPGA
ncbi:efflux RND transporter periplasmic adaptor subunit [Phenylobacterium aquaticum]|uniref:efflux RND transporter periplasmic adaptor subunit n=1 Tax=Phenylobacterium aquaticum TaxID=1763816 RepID=UPI0026F24400|nr:efflux RND transporter periplasmic adaptor subunit [Phenylobacterium aquaticum]